MLKQLLFDRWIHSHSVPTNKKKIRRFVSCFAANFYLAVISGAMMVQQFQMDKFLVRLDQLDKGTNSRRVVRTLSGDIVDNSISIKSVVSSSSQKRDRVDQTNTFLTLYSTLTLASIVEAPTSRYSNKRQRRWRNLYYWHGWDLELTKPVWQM